MKRYRNYRAKKFRLPRKVLFFTVIAVAITLFTVILGNILKSNLEEANIDRTEILTDNSDSRLPPEKEEPDTELVPHDEKLATVSAGELVISLEEDAPAAAALVQSLKEEGYNTVSFNVYDQSSRICYASPAIQELTKMPASDSLIPFDTLCSVIQSAKDMGMRTSCIIWVTNGPSDEVIAKELSEAGFDEIIIRGFEKYTQLDNDLVALVNDYVEKIREAAKEDTDIGICFDSVFYTMPANAPYIEKVYNFANFLAIDLTDATPDSFSTTVGELQGSFSAYLLRAILNGSDEEMAPTIKAHMEDMFLFASQYVSAPSESEGDGE